MEAGGQRPTTMVEASGRTSCRYGHGHDVVMVAWWIWEGVGMEHEDEE